MSSHKLDPYTSKAENDNLTPQEKIDGLHHIVKGVKTGMLTTRSESGQLHSRAMAPVSFSSPHQVALVFLANRVSHKFDEIQHDAHVNVSFCDPSTTNWASFAGTAKISQDREKIKQHWNPMTAAWFGDLGDGTHKGDHTDPRVAVIEVIPDEIRYWTATRGAVGRAVDVAVSAATGKTATPGELRMITKDEIELVQGLTTKTS
ncbi:uncharacterized protein BXZ73DRAFT_97896 [Epithele typhae]|uniref:uncharacterized protein n=1 Tax=Epithele typhae TaxID=378194 RepID=UPI002007BD7A|nr:uncharacterized protein BXZ73DRAFT_97896 [Epithele typhae]KAH9942486.1 hypothetical protein BXZ73DRAFT_97896 [Epithele typhae]